MVTSYISSARNNPYPSTIEVFFSHNMLNNAALIDPNSYRLDGGAYVTNVSIIDAGMIRLTAENLFGHEEFILSIVNSAIESVEGYAIDTNITATIRLAVPDEKIYAISAANGRLKSGRIAKKVCSDNRYFYVMTESGLDIIYKNSLFNKGFVLQQPGFTTICISGNDED